MVLLRQRQDHMTRFERCRGDPGCGFLHPAGIKRAVGVVVAEVEFCHAVCDGELAA